MVAHNWLWRREPVTDANVVIVDIDGVVSDASRRQHLLALPDPDWEAFFLAAVDDELIAATVRLVDTIAADHLIVMLSARPLGVQSDTVEWFERHGVRWDLLILREHGGYLDAPAFKQRSTIELREAGLHPVVALDDDPRNVAMFESLDVPCVYVHSGYYH